TNANAAAPKEVKSRTLNPFLEGAPNSRDAAWSEWHVHPSRCGVGLQLRTVRMKTHKCTFELGTGAGELYDLVHDPAEMHNRFDDPAFRKVRGELEALMRARPGKVQ